MTRDMQVTVTDIPENIHKAIWESLRDCQYKITHQINSYYQSKEGKKLEKTAEVQLSFLPMKKQQP